jgi:hypothetical protein
VEAASRAEASRFAFVLPVHDSSELGAAASATAGAVTLGIDVALVASGRGSPAHETVAAVNDATRRKIALMYLRQ